MTIKERNSKDLQKAWKRFLRMQNEKEKNRIYARANRVDTVKAVVYDIKDKNEITLDIILSIAPNAEKK